MKEPKIGKGVPETPIKIIEAGTEDTSVDETDTVLRSFADVNTTVEESDFVKRRNREMEESERNLRDKAREIQENLVAEIVNKSEKERVLLDKRLELLKPKGGELELIDTLRKIQDSILEHLENLKNEKKSNILTKKIQQQELINLHELLLRFEDLKNRITYGVLDFQKNFEIEKEQIDGRTEPYLASGLLFDLILEQLSKLEKMLAGQDFLKDYVEKISNIRETLKNPDHKPEKAKSENKESEKLRAEETVEEKDSVVDLARINETKESNERLKFTVLFEKVVEIPNLSSITSILRECEFDTLKGEVVEKTRTPNKKPLMKIISFGSNVNKDEIDRALKQNGLRFANIREFLILMKNYRSKVLSKTRKENKRKNKDYDLEDVMTSKLVTFDQGKKINFFEYVNIELDIFNFDKVESFNNIFSTSSEDSDKVAPLGEYYVVADHGMEDILDDPNVSSESSNRTGEMWVQGIRYEFGPMLGRCGSIKEALQLLGNINSELKPGEKPWRFPTKREIKEWDRFEQKIKNDESLDHGEKSSKVTRFYKLLGFEIGPLYIFHKSSSTFESDGFRIQAGYGGINFRDRRNNEAFLVRVMR